MTQLALFLLPLSQAAVSKFYSFLHRFVDPSKFFVPPWRLFSFSRMPSLFAHNESRIDLPDACNCAVIATGKKVGKYLQ